MSHQAPPRPMHFTNVQDFQYGPPQGVFVPSVFPPGMSPVPPVFPPGMPPAPSPFVQPFLHPHPPYAQPMPMVPNPYGQFQAYIGLVDPTHVPNQQVAQAPVGLPQAPAPQPQSGPASKNHPN